MRERVKSVRVAIAFGYLREKEGAANERGAAEDGNGDPPTRAALVALVCIPEASRREVSARPVECWVHAGAKAHRDGFGLVAGQWQL